MTAQTIPTPGSAARRLTGSHRSFSDRAFRSTTALAALAVGLLIVAIGLLLVWNSREAFQEFGLGFIFGTTWDPVKGIYGALPYILGTIFSSVIAIVLAAPDRADDGDLPRGARERRVAIPLTFLDRAARGDPQRRLRAVGRLRPQPVPGLDGRAVRSSGSLGWIPIFAGPSYGIGLFSAGIILTIMILPTIVAISREVITPCPTRQREAMLALGATRWEIDPRRGPAVRPLRDHRRDHPRPRPGARRDDGGDDGHRQRRRTIPTRLFDQGQTIAIEDRHDVQRGVDRPPDVGADRPRPDPARDHDRAERHRPAARPARRPSAGGRA